MDEDSLIRVLYYLNPHSFWVEVKNHDTYALRQVGLFGVVPRQASLVDGERVFTKSDRWDLRANEIVEEFLESKNPLYFKSIYRLDDDNIQTSIFNNQPHIFGEISSIRKDGGCKQLTNCLDNSVYAYKSKNEFWQMLHKGKIKTKLNEDEEINVLLRIVEMYQAKGMWNRKKDVFYKSLTPSQLSKLKTKQESSPKLTTENLERHHILTQQQNNTFSIENLDKTAFKETKMAAKHYKDFNCDDKLAVGYVEGVLKKLTIESKPEKTHKQMIKVLKKEKMGDTELVLSDITVYDEEINPQGSGDEDFSERAMGRANSRIHRCTSNTQSDNKFEELLKIKDKFRRCSNSNAVEPNTQKDVQYKNTERMSQEKRSDYFNQLEEYVCSDASPSGITEERLVAYGPPMNDKHNLVRKLVNKQGHETNTQPQKELINISGDKIDWDNQSDKSEELAKKLKTFDGNNINRSFVKECKTDLNNPKSYNVFVQSKQGNIEMSETKSDMNEKTNGSDMSMSSQTLNVDKENLTPAQKKSRNKLLEIMRKRQPKLNDGLSSTDSGLKPVETSTNGNKDYSSLKPMDRSQSRINNDDSDDLNAIHEKLKFKHPPFTIATKSSPKVIDNSKPNVNPYKNLDGSKSVFVENLVQPLMLAHTKNNNKILPQTDLRDIPFKTEIHNTLRNMLVKEPSRLQSISWPYILRGHSMFIISAPDSGKTLGYLPAVCNLVLDYNFDFRGSGPIVIIICATAFSVTNVAKSCQMFLNNQRVVACYPGIDNTKLVTDLLNGCAVLVSTPSLLYRLLGAEIGVDLRRLTTVVFEDCERLEQVYELEVKAIHLYVRQMLETRTDKQVKVQYVLASRKWCDFMNSLAKKAPDTIITFAAFHECVLYSKTNTSVSFVKRNKKVDVVLEFLKDTDDSKLTVIVCRDDDEVDLLESTLTSLNYTVVACNNRMTIHDLYKIRTEEFSSILICCDGNLKHLNVTYANYLVHFSMPAAYTQFCKRFAVLNDNYASIFGPAIEDVKVKILLEETNVEQLPKILRFVKRCSSKVPDSLNEISRKVMRQKDLEKAENLVVLCSKVLAFGECEDIYTCTDRHAVLEGYDEPKTWVPRHGVITFKVIHYHSATSYSAKLLTHATNNNRTKYPETYKTLTTKLGLYFSKENNKRSHIDLKVGDVCAVAMRKNFISRCEVLQIKYEKDQPKSVLINLVDEEKIDVVRAVDLYYLPDEFKSVETHVVRVSLASVKPQDNDLTFSELAVNELKEITDKDEQLYLKGRVVMTVGKTVFVSTLEACVELSALCETVVKYDFKKMLLDKHAVPNPEHLSKLQELCDVGNLKVMRDIDDIPKAKTSIVKKETEYRWAHLDKNDWCDVIFSNTINAGKFFVRPQKFSKCIDDLISDIKRYVADNPKTVDSVCVKDVVLAEFPDDAVYERAIIEEVIDDTKVRCFFVDNADWRDVAVDKLKAIPQKIIKQIPFQSIECRLIGVKPPGEDWTEFSTNWLHDNCLEDEKGNSKRMYVKYFAKAKAEVTGGHKYGVILVDTTTDDDLVINKRMIKLNLAVVDEEEREYLDKPLDFVREIADTSSFDDDLDEWEETKEMQNDDIKRRKDTIPRQIKLLPSDHEKVDWETEVDDKIAPYIPKTNFFKEPPQIPLKNVFAEKPIRSVPLVGERDDDFDEWDVCIDEDLGKCLGLPKISQYINKNNESKDDDNDFFAVKDNDIRHAITDVKKVEGELTDIQIKTDSVVAVNKNRYDKKTKPEVINIDNKILKLPETDKSDLETTKTQDTEERNNKKYSSKDEFDEESISVHYTPANKAILDKVTDTSEMERSNNINILRGVIKDVSLYDSDDTLSITTTNEMIEISGKPNKNLFIKESVLDSDDTKSILTDIDKDLTIENPKETNQSAFDSDDSDIKEVLCPRVKESNKVHNNIIEVNDVKETFETSETKFKGKLIPITEIRKAQIDMTATCEKFDKIAVKDKEANKENIKETVVNECNSELKSKHIKITQTTEPVRTPQVVWKQDKNTITIKIKVIVDNYTLETENHMLTFSAYQNEIKYSFNIELYSVIDKEKTKHSNKGQYILVTLQKKLKKTTNWLKLTKDIKNWIVYDVESIDTSSDEETPVNNDALKIIMDQHEKAMEMDNLDDDDDIDDISGYRYRYD